MMNNQEQQIIFTEQATEIPELVLAQLTPEQYEIRNQLYVVALERAKNKAVKPRKSYYSPFIWETGGGI